MMVGCTLKCMWGGIQYTLFGSQQLIVHAGWNVEEDSMAFASEELVWCLLFFTEPERHSPNFGVEMGMESAVKE